MRRRILPGVCCQQNQILWFFHRRRSTVTKLKRFLGNSNTLEVHDTANEKSSCQLDEIKVEHRHWYDTIGQAKADKDYDNCAWCLGSSTR